MESTAADLKRVYPYTQQLIFTECTRIYPFTYLSDLQAFCKAGGRKQLYRHVTAAAQLQLRAVCASNTTEPSLSEQSVGANALATAICLLASASSDGSHKAIQMRSGRLLVPDEIARLEVPSEHQLQNCCAAAGCTVTAKAVCNLGRQFSSRHTQKHCHQWHLAKI